MRIKEPPIYDVSHWKSIPDFSVISPRPALFITKATEGNWLQDNKFIPFFEGAKRVGFQRGCFHFNRKGTNAVKQAQYFCDFIRPHITPKDYLILDVEEGGERASDLWAWLEYVHGQFPANRRMIYGRKNLLDPIPMTAGERAYFTKIPIWVAGYPIFPDLWNTPAGYIPDQTKWGKVWLWQYSSHGAVVGIIGDVDLNMATPEFLPILFSGDPDPTPIPEPEEPPMATLYGTVTETVTNRLNVRNGPGIAYDTVNYLYAGDRVEASENVGGWWKLTKIIRKSGDVITLDAPSYASTGSGAYIRTDAPPVPPPAPGDAVRLVIESIETRFVVRDDVTGKRYAATVTDAPNVEFVEL